MIISVTSIIETPGACLPFECRLDLQDLQINHRNCLPKPVEVSGQIVNRAGVLYLDAQVLASLDLVCDMCGKQFLRDKQLDLDLPLATETANGDDSEVYLFEGGSVDIAQVVTSAFVLDFGMSVLCKPDCKGICTKCGVDLNHDKCECLTQEADPRLEKLRELLR